VGGKKNSAIKKKIFYHPRTKMFARGHRDHRENAEFPFYVDVSACLFLLNENVDEK
jgi:hypothetical protein